MLDIVRREVSGGTSDEDVNIERDVGKHTKGYCRMMQRGNVTGTFPELFPLLPEFSEWVVGREERDSLQVTNSSSPP